MWCFDAFWDFVSPPPPRREEPQCSGLSLPKLLRLSIVRSNHNFQKQKSASNFELGSRQGPDRMGSNKVIQVAQSL